MVIEQYVFLVEVQLLSSAKQLIGNWSFVYLGALILIIRLIGRGLNVLSGLPLLLVLQADIVLCANTHFIYLLFDGSYCEVYKWQVRGINGLYL